jgi:hypothetical protein
MKFAIDHVFPATTLAVYETLYFDEDFNAALGDALAMGRRLLKLERAGGRIVRHVEFTPKQAKGSQASQAFGTSRASFVEELDFDTLSHIGTWKTVPTMWADRVRNNGTIAFARDGDGTRRSVHGEVKVSLFGFGRLVERAVVAEIEANYARTTTFTVEYLARSPRT